MPRYDVYSFRVYCEQHMSEIRLYSSWVQVAWLVLLLQWAWIQEHPVYKNLATVFQTFDKRGTTRDEYAKSWGHLEKARGAHLLAPMIFWMSFFLPLFYSKGRIKNMGNIFSLPSKTTVAPESSLPPAVPSGWMDLSGDECIPRDRELFTQNTWNHFGIGLNFTLCVQVHP